MSSFIPSSSGPERISHISHYVAPKDAKDRPADPQLILVFGWPAAQVIIQSDMVSGMLGSRETNIHRQLPILKRLAHLGLLGETPLRLLIHVFSGGGAGQFLWLALALEDRPSMRAHTQPLTCLIIDSAPAFHHADMQRVLTFSLTGFKRLVAVAVAASLHVGLKMGSIISGRPLIHEFIREGLSNPKIFPWMDSATPRLYLYSDADQLSLIRDVKAHIEAAKQKGLNVQEVYFPGSPHVQHSRTYPDRYWSAVHSIWDDTFRSKL
ncbi:hypothetical protein B0H17DRAFT_1134291 [Mycena rosella]|uniref:Uncharacterized protein n=1 Tax=Mycena rosella TaxID=1033263 RepID=A0AAD7DGJ4_MYCRO|nr:hypothetical protein B0H17DRAFT_1134291 [Mycena rosella]